MASTHHKYSQVGALESLEGAQKKSPTATQQDDQQYIRLTPLGRLLAKLPVDVEMARTAVFGALLSCLDPALFIAASSSSSKPVFREDSLPSSLTYNRSDHLALYDAYKVLQCHGLETGAHVVCCTQGSDWGALLTRQIVTHILQL